MAKLGEVCYKESSNIAQKDLENHNGIYPIFGASGLIKHVDFYQQENPYIAVVKDGAGVGRIMKLPAKSSVIGTMQYILPKSNINLSFLAYAMENMNLAKYYTGATIPHIYFKDYQKEEIPLPPLEEQQKIAAVLDKVTDLIDKRKQQLAKLNELIKSRFVEMFGDPVTNSYNWSQEELEANATLFNGRAYNQNELLLKGKYPVLRVGNFFSNRNWYYSDLELEENKFCNYGDLLYAWSASFGAQIWKGEKVIYHYHIWKIIIKKNYNKLFLCYLLNYITSYLINNTHGIAMLHLTKKGMEKTSLIVPPLDLQNQFAEFVEQTEKTKVAINRSLDKLETLKKTLMQKYFG